MQSIPSPDLVFTYIGPSCSLSGTFNFSGMVTLNSIMEGEFEMKDQSKVIIERHGLFKGKMRAHHVEIFGQFNGQLHSSGIVSIRSGAQVDGMIDAVSLHIEAGSVVNLEARAKIQQA